MYDLLLFFASAAAFYGVTLTLDLYRTEGQSEAAVFVWLIATLILLVFISIVDMSYFAVLYASISILYGGYIALEEVCEGKGIAEAMLSGAVFAMYWPFMVLAAAFALRFGDTNKQTTAE